ncbi:MAG TPA: helix-turn-helix domain-containing protein [Candidatus Onthousia excrementipullorum]|uniref:Helix-turn-helix domain-containing protein n=1 Tax=Candidatus Onthousia excrementipullorum TaxID=2840884 RepID=A0A9D1J2Y0_9FIRM|nr:helix-turn-helix domain-containing protein [Candidatus Onthousia excrementipullorum]
MIIKNLRYTRENLGLKQKDLTTLFNVTYSTISGWETGKDTIPLRQLIKYANKYNFSLDYLFGLTKTNKEYLPLEIDLDVISKNLTEIRKQNKKTQEQIAKVLNTSSGGYAHYENSRYLIPTNFIYSLALYYKDFSIDEVLGRKKICN